MKITLVVFSFLVAVLSVDAYRNDPKTQDQLKKDFIRNAVLKALDDAFENDDEVASPYPHDNEINDVEENRDESFNPDSDAKALGQGGRPLPNWLGYLRHRRRSLTGKK